MRSRIAFCVISEGMGSILWQYIPLWGHPHYTYAQKSRKKTPKKTTPPPTFPLVPSPTHFGLTPLPPLPPPHFVRTYFLYIPPLLINFYSDSNFRHSQFLGNNHFYLSLRLNFTKPIPKRFLFFYL